MSRADTYSRKAWEIRRQARTEPNVSTRVELELLALAYDRLAEQAERNARNNIVYEHDPDAIAERRSQGRRSAQVQQQQQQRSKRHR